MELNQTSARNAALKTMIERNLKDGGYQVVSTLDESTYKITISPLQDGVGQKMSFYVIYWKNTKKGLVHFRVNLTETATDKILLNYQVRGKMEAGKAYKLWKIFGPVTEDNTPDRVE